MYLSVIVPTYNESKIIFKNLILLKEALSKMDISYEIIVSDDGSTDDTCAVVSYFEFVKLVRSKVNTGKGHAVRRGLGEACGEWTCMIDADLSISPEHIASCLKKQKQTGAPIVIGSKMHSCSTVNYPLKRRITSLAYYALIKLLFNLPIKDTQTGLKLFRTDLLRFLIQHAQVKRFAFDLEFMVIARALGHDVAEMPVTVKELRSRIKAWSVWCMLLDTCAIWYRLNILHYYHEESAVEPYI